MPPPALSALPGGDVDRGSRLYATFWTQVPIAFLFLTARFYVRISTKSVSWDDWWMLITWILFFLGMTFASILVSHGDARHLYYLTPAEIVIVQKFTWIAQAFSIIALATAKISVSLLLLKIIGPMTVWRKRILWFNMVFFMLQCIVSVSIIFGQCRPMRALWEPVPGAHCLNPKVQENFTIAASAYSAMMDFVLAFVPVTIVYNLKMEWKKRAALCILLGMGFFAGIAAVLKTIDLQELTARADITWASFTLYQWACSELFLLVICGCIPTLRPLWERVAKGKLLRPSKASSGGSNQYDHKLISKSRGGGYIRTDSSNGPSVTASYAGKFPKHSEILTESAIDIESLQDIERNSDTFLTGVSRS